MKASVWNILSVAFLVGTVFVVVIFMLIFLLPNQVLPASMRPISVPPTLVMPSPTETVYQFPPTWTKSPRPETPSSTPVPPSNTPGQELPEITSTGTVGFVLPSESPTATASLTNTSTITKTISSSKAVIINGTAYTFTKTKKPTATKTKAPSSTPGGIPPFSAVKDIATVGPYPSSVLINVLANDYNSTGSAIHIIAIPNSPDHGDLEVVSDSTIKYWPDPGFLGIDTFSYKMQNVSGSTATGDVIVYVMDGSNEIPTDIIPGSFEFDEQQAAGIEIGQFDTLDDSSGPFKYKLVSGTGSTGNDKFLLSGSGRLTSKAVYDYEMRSSYSIRVRSTDSGGFYVDKVITIYIRNINEPPIIRSQDEVSGKENKSFSYTFTVFDPDAGDTISISYEPNDKLPPGLVFEDLGNKSAKISGIPTEKGVYTFNIHAMDASGLEVVKAIKITINAGPTVTPSATATTAP